MITVQKKSILQLFVQFKEIENIVNVGVCFKFLNDQRSTEVDDVQTTAIQHVVMRQTKPTRYKNFVTCSLYMYFKNIYQHLLRNF